jgi:hypothetical protein
MDTHRWIIDSNCSVVRRNVLPPPCKGGKKQKFFMYVYTTVAAFQGQVHAFILLVLWEVYWHLLHCSRSQLQRLKLRAKIDLSSF